MAGVIKLNIVFGLFGFVFILLSGSFIYKLQVHVYSLARVGVTGVLWIGLFVGLSLTSLLLSVVSLHIVSLSKSESHSVPSVALQYLLYVINRITSHYIKRNLKKAWRNPRQAQELLLMALLDQNRATEYGKRYVFSTIKNLEEFRKRHPLTKYTHYEDYIERMARGEDNVLMASKPTRFALTSGTTGKGKVLPVSSDLEKRIYQIMAVYKDKILMETFPHFSPLKKVARLYWEPTTRSTSGSYTLGPLSQLNHKFKYLVSVTSSSPAPAFSIKDIEVCTYVHSLFAIRERYVSLYMTAYTTSLYSMMKHLEQHWRQMLDDISTGTINQDLNLPNDVRAELEKSFLPDPVRAEEVRREFERGFEGIIARLWPGCVGVTGRDAAGIKTSLKETYCKGLPLYGTDYVATEGLLGVNINPLHDGSTDRFVLLPNINVMEFIPEDNMGEDQPGTVFIDELETGQNYEMALTLSTGLCRFRFGDVIKVVDYYGNCPVIEFQYRSGQMLNVCGEKVDQALVSTVMNNAMASWKNGALIDYTCAESNLLLQGGRDPGSKPYYIFFIELDDDNSKTRPSDKLNVIDELLCEQSFTYNSYREKNLISPAQVYLVKPGAFKVLQDYIISNTTASMNQFKNHRKLQTWNTLDLMLKNIV